MLSKQTNFKLPKNKQILKSKINIKTNQTKLYKVELKGKQKGSRWGQEMLNARRKWNKKAQCEKTLLIVQKNTRKTQN